MKQSFEDFEPIQSVNETKEMDIDRDQEERADEEKRGAVRIRRSKKEAVPSIEKTEKNPEKQSSKSIKRTPSKPRVSKKIIAEAKEEIAKLKEAETVRPETTLRPVWERPEPPMPPKEPWWKVWKKDWFRKFSTTSKIVTAPTIAAAGGFGTGPAEDTLIAKQEITTPTRSLRESIPLYDERKLEAAGVFRIDPVETSDTTKQVFLISLKSYKSYGDIEQAIKKAGLLPSSPEVLEDIADRGSDIAKKSRSIMSMKHVTNKLGHESFAFITYDTKAGRFHMEEREINVGIDSQWDHYRFAVEVPRKTALYQEGLVKK